jgi:hypothetical protein
MAELPALPSDFDPATYLRLNPDVAAAEDDPAKHYVTHGLREGRRYRHSDHADNFPLALPTDFDAAEYLRLNPDVAAAGADAGAHYLKYGTVEGRRYKDAPVSEAQPVFGHLNRFITQAPCNQNIVDLFEGKWSSMLPVSANLITRPGYAALFEDERITWASEVLGPFLRKKVLELGPLEGGHSYMLNALGAEVTAIEANAEAFLRCLCIKEIFGLNNVRFLLGDFLKFFTAEKYVFDAIIASGVLYHMTNPVALLEAIERSSDRVFLWTHYFDEELHSGRDDRDLFDLDSATANNLKGLKGRRKRYHQDALQWQGFTGGTAPSAVWLERGSILEFFRDHGYVTKVNFEDRNHPNGPAFAICASR